MLLGLPCEHGTSVPRQSGWYRRGCHHFSADSVLPRHYHCEIPSGRASGLSAFLEYYEREQSHQHSSSCQPLPPPCDLTPPDQGEGCGSQLTIGMGPSCSHFHYSLALLFSNSLFSSPPQGVFLFPTSASLSEFVFWCVSVCLYWPMSVGPWASASGPRSPPYVYISEGTAFSGCVSGCVYLCDPHSQLSNSFSSSVLPVWG